MREYDSPEYKKWRKDIYTRDNHKCQWPGCNITKKLNAHHIKRWADNPGLRFNPLNGITLCKEHHKMVTGLESYYEAVFMKIVADNNDKRPK
jgi:5-methylcytosine-specific restriction endonuclease McrA